MRPHLPTPHETAQWIVEAHAENILWEMTDVEHEDYIANLRLVCDRMSAIDLRQALGAIVDIAQELVIELADSDIDPDRILELVRAGRGRPHATPGLPVAPSMIAAALAWDLAAVLARTDMWAHVAGDCTDESLLEAYEVHCEEAEAAVAERPLDHLRLVGANLKSFSEALAEAGASWPENIPVCPSPDGGGCRGHIDDWSPVIRAQSKALFERDGSVDRAWHLHHWFFRSST